MTHQGLIWPRPEERLGRVTIVDLREAIDWSPRQLQSPIWRPTGEPGADSVPPYAPDGTPVRALGDLAEILAISRPSVDISTVRPADVDRGDGGIRSYASDYKGRVLVVDGRKLRLGDIVVPDDPQRPAVLLDERHQGLAFTATFTAVRPRLEVMDPVLIWALLSSSPGFMARADFSNASASLGNARTPRRALRQLLLPLQVPGWPSRREDVLALHHRAAVALPAARSTSAWTIRDLAQQDSWRPVDVLRPPIPEREGTSLAELCTVLRRGSAARNMAAETPTPGWLPVATVTQVNRGTTPRRWVPADSAGSGVGRTGDVVVGLVGERSAAVVLATTCAVDRDMAVMRVTDETSRDAIVTYLTALPARSSAFA